MFGLGRSYVCSWLVRVQYCSYKLLWANVYGHYVCKNVGIVNIGECCWTFSNVNCLQVNCYIVMLLYCCIFYDFFFIIIVLLLGTTAEI